MTLTLPCPHRFGAEMLEARKKQGKGIPSPAVNRSAPGRSQRPIRHPEEAAAASAVASHAHTIPAWDRGPGSDLGLQPTVIIVGGDECEVLNVHNVLFISCWVLVAAQPPEWCVLDPIRTGEAILAENFSLRRRSPRHFLSIILNCAHCFAAGPGQGYERATRFLRAKRILFERFSPTTRNTSRK